MILVSAILVIVTNLLVDLAYGLIDPRVGRGNDLMFAALLRRPEALIGVRSCWS